MNRHLFDESTNRIARTMCASLILLGGTSVLQAEPPEVVVSGGGTPALSRFAITSGVANLSGSSVAIAAHDPDAQAAMSQQVGLYELRQTVGQPFAGTLSSGGRSISLGFWNSAADTLAPPSVLPDPSGLNKTRFISFVPPGGAGETALRVVLDSLHHVFPPYSGGPSVPFTSFEGQVRWVGPPTQYVESGASGIPFYASRLQCTAHYQDWSTVGLLHVTGSAITPSSQYDVENLAASCLGAESSCAAVSAPLSIVTTRWGDVRSLYNPPDPSIQPDISDVSALVDKFRSAAGAPIKARGLLAGAPGNAFGEITHEVLSVDFGFSHISACVDAYRGAPYPYTISTCP